VDIEMTVRYRSALDTAVRLATALNVEPLPGYTAVFCDVSGSMRYVRANTAKGLGRSMLHPYDIAMLLGGLIHNVSESGELQMFGSRGQHPVPHAPVHIPETARGRVLESMRYMRQVADTVGGGNEFFYDWFEDLIERKVKVDRLVVLTDVMIDRLDTRDQGYYKNQDWTIASVVAEYRRQVNPDFKFITIDLYGSGKSLTNVSESGDQRDVLITGYSDRILQFIGAKPRAQLDAVERMHERLVVVKEATSAMSKMQVEQAAAASDREEAAAA